MTALSCFFVLSSLVSILNAPPVLVLAVRTYFDRQTTRKLVLEPVEDSRWRKKSNSPSPRRNRCCSKSSGRSSSCCTKNKSICEGGGRCPFNISSKTKSGNDSTSPTEEQYEYRLYEPPLRIRKAMNGELVLEDLYQSKHNWHSWTVGELKQKVEAVLKEEKSVTFPEQHLSVTLLLNSNSCSPHAPAPAHVVLDAELFGATPLGEVLCAGGKGNNMKTASRSFSEDVVTPSTRASSKDESCFYHNQALASGFSDAIVPSETTRTTSSGEVWTSKACQRHCGTENMPDAVLSEPPQAIEISAVIKQGPTVFSSFLHALVREHNKGLDSNYTNDNFDHTTNLAKKTSTQLWDEYFRTLQDSTGPTPEPVGAAVGAATSSSSAPAFSMFDQFTAYFRVRKPQFDHGFMPGYGEENYTEDIEEREKQRLKQFFSLFEQALARKSHFVQMPVQPLMLGEPVPNILLRRDYQIAQLGQNYDYFATNSIAVYRVPESQARLVQRATRHRNVMTYQIGPAEGRVPILIRGDRRGGRGAAAGVQVQHLADNEVPPLSDAPRSVSITATQVPIRFLQEVAEISAGPNNGGDNSYDHQWPQRPFESVTERAFRQKLTTICKEHLQNPRHRPETSLASIFGDSIKGQLVLEDSSGRPRARMSAAMTCPALVRRNGDDENEGEVDLNYLKVIPRLTLQIVFTFPINPADVIPEEVSAVDLVLPYRRERSAHSCSCLPDNPGRVLRAICTSFCLGMAGR